MARIIIVGTPRYSINMVDLDLVFRNSDHHIVKVLYHDYNTRESWFSSGVYSDAKRNKICTKLTDHSSARWKNIEQLFDLIDKLDFDYLAIGNGNDRVGLSLRNRYSNKKFLFTEYGFLPWNECCYVDDQGVGRNSSLFGLKSEDMNLNSYDEEYVTYIKKGMMGGNKLSMKKFIYVPLQVDVPDGEGNPDFKFRFTKFKNNVEFLSHIKKIIPSEYKILVKNHPLAPKRTKIPEGMIDITNMRFSKYSIYKRMKAMVGINSTSMIEGILFNRRVFSYGEDIFSNKGIMHVDVENNDEFSDRLKTDVNIEINKRFISTILERQFIRHRYKDIDYVKNHYWNRKLI